MSIIVNSKAEKANTSLWGVVGPFLISCTFFIIAIRFSSMRWELPLIGLLGFLISSKWHWKGVLISICLLIGFLIYSLNVDSAEWLWLTVLTSSIAATFIITALSQEESRYAWEILRHDAHEQENAISALLHKYEDSKKELEQQQHLFSLKQDQFQTDIRLSQEKVVASEKLLKCTQEDLAKTHSQHQKIFQELASERLKSDFLQKQLEKEKAANNTFLVELESLRRQHQYEIENLAKLKNAKILHETTIQDLNQRIDILSKEKSAIETSFTQLQNEFSNLSLNFQKLSEQTTLPSNNNDDREFRRMEGLYNQLREQFAQKSALLDTTRQELFHAQEKLLKSQKEMDEYKLLHEREADAQISKILRSAENELRNSEQQQIEIEQLQDLISTLLASRE